MKKHWLCGAVVAVAFAISGVAAHAQSRPKLDVFAGYSYTTFGFGVATNQNLNGYGLEVAYNANDHFGMVASFSGNNGTHTYTNTFETESGNMDQDVDAYYFLFGPRLTQQIGKVDVFAEGLVGVAKLRWSASDPSSTTSFARGSDKPFAAAVGGGADWNFNSRFGWRILQLDALFTRGNGALFNEEESEPGNSDKNIRLETGIVFHF